MSLTYRFSRKPYAHQVRALRFLLSTKRGGALLMEPRTGKTKVVIDYMCILHLAGKVNRVMVFCPVGVMGVWREQLEANCTVPYRMLVWDKDARKDTALPKYGKDVLDIVIVNYDALSTPGAVIGKDKEGNIKRSKSRGGRFAVKRAIQRWQPQLLVLDESHRIKSPSARKTTAIHSLRKVPEYRVIMTGTVQTKKKRYFDIYSQWKFLNEERFGGMTFGEFKDHFGKWKQVETSTGGKYPKFLGARNQKELHQLIHRDAFSVRRDECYDLPAKTSQIIPVELEESAQVYDQMAEDMVARIRTGEITEASIPLVQQLRLQQITSGLAKTMPTLDHPEGRLVVVGSEKLRVLQDRLEDLLEADEKIVIGAQFTGDILRIQKLVRKMKGVPCYVIRGGVKPAERDRARNEFNKVDGGAVFIGQPAAASEGIDLSAASIMIWYSLTPSWVHFTQFSDRIALSEHPTFHEFLLARGTIDELRYQGLLEDEDVGKMMITSPERLLREAGH